jgi:hypothetical protein
MKAQVAGTVESERSVAVVVLQGELYKLDSEENYGKIRALSCCCSHLLHRQVPSAVIAVVGLAHRFLFQKRIVHENPCRTKKQK